MRARATTSNRYYRWQLGVKSKALTTRGWPVWLFVTARSKFRN